MMKNQWLNLENVIFIHLIIIFISLMILILKPPLIFANNLENTYLNVHEIRKDFPILNRKINGKSLVYFDNAATAQTPKQVIDVIVDYYSLYNANIHRGVHQLSQEATDKYEESRADARGRLDMRRG